MKKIAIAILVVLAALCLCSCAGTQEKVEETKYPRIYTVTEASREAVLLNAIKSVSAESAAAVGGIAELEKAVKSQIPAGFLKITLINDKRCSMMVSLTTSTNVLEGRIENGSLVFEVGDTKDVYQLTNDMQMIMGNWYGVDVVLVYDEI